MPGEIYAIVNKVTGELYVGSTGRADGARLRWNEHKTKLRAGTHESPPLLAAWQRHGCEAFTVTVLEHVDGSVGREQLLAREQCWLDAYRPFPPRGYNTCPTAGSSLGTRHREESKRRIGEKSIGRKFTLSEATKQLMRESALRRVATEEGRRQMLEARKRSSAARLVRSASRSE